MAKFGSFQNLMMGRAAAASVVTPTVGMGATEVMYSDRHAFTVVEVISPTRIKVRADRATRVDKNGMSDAQQYKFTPDPKGRERVLTKRRNGKWVPVGESQNAPGFLLGVRSEYRDYTR
ncbi:MAG TPA: hypothetical protein VF668_01335 [Pyrinomonadaceae bacterium]